MKAVIWNGTAAELVTDKRPPRLRPDYVLISTVAVALNPTDTKAISQGRAAKDGLCGSDFSGVVLEVGAQVTKPFKKGDRVFGFAHGANSNEAEDGAWAEVIAAKGDCLMKMPDSGSNGNGRVDGDWGFEGAATAGASVFTSGQGLFLHMKLRLPDPMGLTVAAADTEPAKEYILVYGGSSSAGTLAIQYLTLAGYTVVATCSPRNFELCKSRGAEAVFDYRDPDCGKKIHSYTHGQLKLIWDTIGSDDGVRICVDAMSTEPGTDKRYGTILFNDFPRSDVKHSFSVLHRFAGEAFDKFGQHYPASQDEFEFAKMFSSLTETLVAQAKLQSHPVRLVPAGLKGMLDEGVSLAQNGGVSGVKIVARVADTP
ncbi:hypothetical protein A1O1_05463 [Capronia coronata CBS 617.96]|uniref:Enoyl reductase (ER) domain-containing protein n=1 Tax=Capronia coronata CBS 617.96 TaxID=1182541 RepID=W9Y7N0_9EURO|nr:uncharacterized protein A1O1_05463 [Capronia coronata CBS 617.96]EXJ88533.1 hypothetical protein A1O1_05463 [Capronia coronata CBS 617.96]